MGLFGSDSGDDRAHSVAANARGESVTAHRLTKNDGGLMQKDLFDSDPAIIHIEPEEQPHHFFYNDTKGITRDGATGGGGADTSYRSLCIVTDERLLFFTDGSKGVGIPLTAISAVAHNIGRMKHRLTVETADHEYTFYINNTIDSDEVEACSDYLESKANTGSTEADGGGETILSGLSGIWTSELDEAATAEEALDADPQGSYVTEERFEKVKGILDPGEKVHFITRGSTVDVEGSGAGESLWGDDRSRKTGTRGWVRAIITDKRVAIKIPQVLGTDHRSVPYSSLTSTDLDTGLINKRLTLQTAGQTYHIEAQDPNKEEVRRAIRFIRQQVEKANQPDVVQQQPTESEPDPLEQIEKLKDLHDAGAISDAEFQEKKQDLLDKV